MKDYSRTIECNHEEYIDLVAQLKATEGFRVLLPGMSTQDIYHKDIRGMVGQFEKHFDNRHLTIYSPENLGVEMNPLEEFINSYNPLEPKIETAAKKEKRPPTDEGVMRCGIVLPPEMI